MCKGQNPLWEDGKRNDWNGEGGVAVCSFLHAYTMSCFNLYTHSSSVSAESSCISRIPVIIARRFRLFCMVFCLFGFIIFYFAWLHSKNILLQFNRFFFKSGCTCNPTPGTSLSNNLKCGQCTTELAIWNAPLATKIHWFW